MTTTYINRDRAVFTFAGQSNTHTITGKPATAVRNGNLPVWMSSPADLDFLDPTSPLFHVDRALFSMGQFLYGAVPQGMFSKRPGVTILGDSGGYQLIENPALWQGNSTRQWVLTALEHETNEAMTLDVPTKGIKPGTPWPTFHDALAVTQDSLLYFDRTRVGNTRFLNVLQGRTRREAKAWLSAVEWFPAGGWAFGGDMRRDFIHVVSTVVDLADRGLIAGDRNRLHFLGMADLSAAVLLTALQRGLRVRTGDPNILITFDVSSPSILASKRKAYSYPSMSSKSLALGTWSPPSTIDPRYPMAYASARWPVRTTAVGKLLWRGDLCVLKPGSTSGTAWDALTEAMIVNHNVEALLIAIDMANDLLEMPQADAAANAPVDLVAGYHAVIAACSQKDPQSYLRPFGYLNAI